MAFTSSVVIERSPQEAWEYLTDWSRASTWMNGIDGMELQDGGPAAVGSHLVFQSRGAERLSEIVVFEPAKRLVLRSVQGGVSADYVYVLEAQGEGTRLTLTARCEFRGLWKLLSPIISRAMARSDSDQPERLKRALSA